MLAGDYLYPCLIIRVVPLMCHVILLPRDWRLRELTSLAWTQARLNDLPVCLAYRRGIHWNYAPDGSHCFGPISWAKVIVMDFLESPVPLPDSEELRERKRLLADFIEARKFWGGFPGFIMGDYFKGGHKATAEEAARLAGLQADGVPTGLSRCPRCGEWRGECLDPNPQFQGYVVPVHCRCDNQNRCAHCGELLFELKLNGNEYKADGQVWHTPGFSAFNKHTCPELGSAVGDGACALRRLALRQHIPAREGLGVATDKADDQAWAYTTRCLAWATHYAFYHYSAMTGQDYDRVQAVLGKLHHSNLTCRYREIVAAYIFALVGAVSNQPLAEAIMSWLHAGMTAEAVAVGRGLGRPWIEKLAGQRHEARVRVRQC